MALLFLCVMAIVCLMILIYKERYPYSASQKYCIEGLTNFDNANDDPDPKCLLGKFWEIIKLDFSEWV